MGLLGQPFPQNWHVVCRSGVRAAAWRGRDGYCSKESSQSRLWSPLHEASLGTLKEIHICVSGLVYRSPIRDLVEGQKATFEIETDRRSGKAAAANLQAA